MPRSVRRLLAPIAIVALALVGCVPGEPPVTPSPTTGGEPMFASEAEALAAAEEAYRSYNETVDEILRDGGNDSARLAPLVSPELLASQQEGFDQFKSNGWHATGSTELRNFTLQQFDGQSLLVLYVCSDVSGVDVVDSSGVSQVSPTRPTTTTFEASLELQGSTFIVAEDRPWEGSSVC